MASVQSFDGAKINQIKKQKSRAGAPGVSTKVPFFGSRDAPEAPHAFFTQWGSARMSSPHFHENDQFQVVIAGKGTIGRHSLAPYSVHFTRAYTPYGPLSSDADSTMSFFVMRPRYDGGSQRMPQEREKLRAVPNRQPLQVTCNFSFPEPATGAHAPGILLQSVPEMRNDDGLAGYTLNVQPNTKAYAPDPARSGGQYLVVVVGSLLHDDKEYKAPALVFVPPAEGPFELCAGAQELQALVLDFPRRETRAPSAEQRTTGLKRWQCQLCGFAYDEAAGLPEDGIAPGTRWEDVPSTWSCPDCSASKSDFQMVEI